MADEIPPGDMKDALRTSAPVSRFEAREKDFEGANDEALVIKLQLLQQEHADLDAAIRALAAQAHHDRLSVARLKKKKLLLKDLMQALRDQLTPDIIA